jgi:hypothetical protein
VVPSNQVVTPAGQQINYYRPSASGRAIGRHVRHCYDTIVLGEVKVRAILRDKKGQQIPVGNAPRGLVVLGNHAYISNQGGGARALSRPD